MFLANQRRILFDDVSSATSHSCVPLQSRPHRYPTTSALFACLLAVRCLSVGSTRSNMIHKQSTDNSAGGTKNTLRSTIRQNLTFANIKNYS